MASDSAVQGHEREIQQVMIWIEKLIQLLVQRLSSDFKRIEHLAENGITDIRFARTGTVHVSSQQIQMSPEYQRAAKQANLIVHTKY